MPEKCIRETGLTHSALRPFTKKKERKNTKFYRHKRLTIYL